MVWCGMEKEGKDTRYVDKLYGPPRLTERPLQWARYRFFDRDVLVSELSETKCRETDNYRKILRDFFLRELKLELSSLTDIDLAQVGADLLTCRAQSNYFKDSFCQKLPDDYAQEIWNDLVNASRKDAQIHALRINLRDQSKAINDGLGVKTLRIETAKNTSREWNSGNGGGQIKTR